MTAERTSDGSVYKALPLVPQQAKPKMGMGSKIQLRRLTALILKGVCTSMVPVEEESSNKKDRVSGADRLLHHKDWIRGSVVLVEGERESSDYAVTY